MITPIGQICAIKVNLTVALKSVSPCGSGGLILNQKSLERRTHALPCGIMTAKISRHDYCRYNRACRDGQRVRASSPILRTSPRWLKDDLRAWDAYGWNHRRVAMECGS